MAKIEIKFRKLETFTSKENNERDFFITLWKYLPKFLER